MAGEQQKLGKEVQDLPWGMQRPPRLQHKRKKAIGIQGVSSIKSIICDTIHVFVLNSGMSMPPSQGRQVLVKDFFHSGENGKNFCLFDLNFFAEMSGI